MSSLFDTLAKTIEIGKKIHGADIDMMIGRCPMYGDKDTCIIITGKNHAGAAKGFTQVKGAKFTVLEGVRFRTGEVYTYTTVEF